MYASGNVLRMCCGCVADVLLTSRTLCVRSRSTPTYTRRVCQTSSGIKHRPEPETLNNKPSRVSNVFRYQDHVRFPATLKTKYADICRTHTSCGVRAVCTRYTPYMYCRVFVLGIHLVCTDLQALYVRVCTRYTPYMYYQCYTNVLNNTIQYNIR